MSQYSQMTLEDVLDQFVAEFPKPTREGLLSFIARHPEHREALVSFAATAAEQQSLPPSEAFSPEEAARFAGRTASVLENHVFQRDQARATLAATPTAASSLSELAAAAGSSLAQITERLSLDMGLAAKLDRRLIRAETIPRRLVDGLAEFLGSTADAVSAVLSGPPRMSTNPSFMVIRSASTPTQETFTEAVTMSSLPEADKERWINAA